MKNIALLMTLALCACTNGQNPDTDTDTDTDTGPQDKSVTEGDCSEMTGGLIENGNYERLPIVGNFNFSHTLFTATIQSDEELAEFQNTYGLTVEDVDFGMHTVLFAAVGASSTCGMSEPEFEVLFHVFETEDGDTAGRVHLGMDVTDFSGTCDAVCDMTWIEFVAVKVAGPNMDPYDKTYTVCATKHDTCE